MTEDACLFCRLVKNEIPSYTVFEDADTRAFLDIFPKAPGHTCVILKKHGWTLSDYTPEELGTLMTSVRKVTAALAVAMKTDVFTIGINHKEALGVHHLHVHIIPRYPEDGGGVIQSIVDNPPKKELGEIRDLIVHSM